MRELKRLTVLGGLSQRAVKAGVGIWIVSALYNPCVSAASRQPIAPQDRQLPMVSDMKKMSSVAECLRSAAKHYDLPVGLLKAIAQVESGGNPRAVSPVNRNGSRDIGLMQINSRWLPRLAASKIDEAALLDPCVSAHVGAWILAGNIARLGPVWRAVGAYNARAPALQLRYVHKVRAAWAGWPEQGVDKAASVGISPP